MGFVKFLDTIENNRIIIMGYSEFSYAIFIEIFIELLIKDTVLLPSQISATKTILATYTRRAKSTITTIRTILGIKNSVTLVTIDTLV